MTSPHGTDSRYVNSGCRCQPCTTAHREYIAKRTAQRYAHTAAHGLPSQVQHGRSAYSNWGCRCDTCSTAAKEGRP